MRVSSVLPKLLLLAFTRSALGGQFAVSGPVLTLTLKEAVPKSTTTSKATDALKSSTPSPTWMDLTALKPNLFWSLQSISPPMPNWFPGWKSLRTNIGYRYDELRRFPSFVETELKFRSERLNAELQVKPTVEVKAQRSNLLVHASRGASYVLARFVANHNIPKTRDEGWESSGSTLSPKTSGLTFLKASYRMNFPATSSVSSLRITPAYDLTTQEPTCELEGITGGSSRTLAILKLNYHNPTLAVVHALDDRNTISPEIALYNAKIRYSWQVALPNGANIKARVDPTSAIEVQWTDTSAADGGRWVTDFRIPLEGTTLQALASDVKVRRQFNF